jgi:NADH:ubiquinone reductase (H+-translocating)
MAMSDATTPRVVILGGGFGGLNAARALGGAPVEVTVIDRTNHHLFQPLLYQVAMATLAPSDVTAPIRWLVRKQRNTTVLLADVHRIEPERRVVVIDDGREVPYDYLVVATGSRHSYFGHDDWEPMAPGLKSLEDALEIRRRFLLAFEHAEKSEDPAEQARLLTFVLVGGGPTGVELAGILPEIARKALRQDFRRVDLDRTRVILVEAGPRILPAFPESLAARAHRDLERLGVEVRTGVAVTRMETGVVWIGEERVEAGTVFWAAGNAASPLARSLGAPLDRAGRVMVRSDLSVPGRPEVFVVGDLMHLEQDGRPLPGVAQVAIQGGRIAARNVLASTRGSPRSDFRYFDKGNLATIGRNKAVADFGRVRFGGFFAWLLWLFVHILYLAGFRNRLSVLIQWGYAYFTQQRGVRLITETEHGAHPDPASARPVIRPGW